MTRLCQSSPELTPFVVENKYKNKTIDFFDPKAVQALNKALLKHHYEIDQWEIPDGYLCPGVPGRAEYIHHIADLLAASNQGKIPRGKNIKCLDVGVGSSGIYPIVGRKEYGWSFVGTDIDQVALNAAADIVSANALLKGNVELRLQPDPRGIFSNVVRDTDYFDLTICNPPFYSSMEEAKAASTRKQRNLKARDSTQHTRNFEGQQNELWCPGGEKQFLQDMIYQSKEFGLSIYWFSSLVSKSSNLKSVYATLEHMEATEVRTIPMGTGNKSSRLVAWTFLTPAKQAAWAKMRWSAR